MATPVQDDSLWDRESPESAEELARQVWGTLRSDPRAVTLETLHQACVPEVEASAENDEDGTPSRAASLLVMPDGAHPRVLGAKDTTAAEDISVFLDAYAMYTRLDAVDEAGHPFVPFVRPLTARQMERFQYGVLLDGPERTVLIEKEFLEPTKTVGSAMQPSAEEDSANDAARRFEGVNGVNYRDVFLLQLRVLPVFPPPPKRDINPMVEPEDLPEEDDAATKQQQQQQEQQEPIAYRVGFVPCFRLRFGEIKRSFNKPELNGTFALASVLVSGHRFWELHDDLRRHVASAPGADYYSRINSDNSPTLRQRQEAWAAWTRLTGNSVLSDPREDPEGAMKVIVPQSNNDSTAANNAGSGVSPRRGGEQPKPVVCGYSVPGAGQLEEVDDAVVADAPAASAVNVGEDFVPRECEYTMDRMASRVQVMERVPGKLPRQWSALCDELGLVSEGPNANAAKVLMRDSRHGTDALEGGELTVHVPNAPTNFAVYETSSEEQLRLWVGAALAVAESRGVRQVLLRLDLPMIVSRCCGLLSLRSLEELRGEADEDGEAVPRPAAVTAREHAIRIVCETVEGFVRGSGVLWRAVIMTEPLAPEDDFGEWSELATAEAELERIRLSKRAQELGAPRAPSPTRGCSRSRKPHVLSEDDIATLSPARRGRSAGASRSVANAAAEGSPGGPVVAARRMRGVDEESMEPALATVPTVYTVSPLPTESDLQKLFKRLDRTGDGALNREELRRLLLPKDPASRTMGADIAVTDRMTIAPRRSQDSYLGCGTVLSPIDDCGVPMTDAKVDEYLDKYSRMNKGKITYQEFCVMMLDLARR